MKSNRSVFRPTRVFTWHEKWRPFAHELRFALRVILFFALLFLASRLWAQSPPPCDPPAPSRIISPETNGATATRRPATLPYVREADVMWSKRVWRTLDMREKMNHPYYYPETPHHGLMSLFDVVRSGLLGGCINAFDNPAIDDEFTTKMSAEAIAGLLNSVDYIEVEDPNNPGTYRIDTIRTTLQTSEIMAWWVKEDWFFDKQRSVMDVRIIGLCPLQAKRDPQTGEVMGYKPLFWVYYPQLRPLLVKHEAFLGQNFFPRLSYDDLLLKRFFSSYVHKESNVYDRTINGYTQGLDAMYESERVKETIRNYESDLWHY